MSKIKMLFGISGEKDKVRALELDTEIQIGEAQKCALAEAHVRVDDKGEFKMFAVGAEKPIKSESCVRDLPKDGGVAIIHLTQCDKVKLDVSYQNDQQILEFSPGAKVSDVRAEILSQFPNIASEDKGNFFLYEKGTNNKVEDRFAIGQYVSGPRCTLSVDLREEQGFQGADMLPDEQQFRADMEKPDFLLGKCQGRWRVDSISWPRVIMAVTSASGTEYSVRFQCDGYPEAPTAAPWDTARDCMARPVNNPISGKMEKVLSQLENKGAFYLPCDRQWQGYSNWATQYPDQLWNRDQGIASYLGVLCDALD